MHTPIGFYVVERTFGLEVQNSMFAAELADISEAGEYVMRVPLKDGTLMIVGAAVAGVDGYPPYAAVTVRFVRPEDDDAAQA